MTMPVGVMACVPTVGTNEMLTVWLTFVPTRIAMPLVTLPPTDVAVHAVPSTVADIDRGGLVLVLVGPVEVLPPHAAETINAEIAINTRGCMLTPWETSDERLTTLRRSPLKTVIATFGAQHGAYFRRETRPCPRQRPRPSAEPSTRRRTSARQCSGNARRATAARHGMGVALVRVDSQRASRRKTEPAARARQASRAHGRRLLLSADVRGGRSPRCCQRQRCRM